jgi:hypothetical protein
MKLTFFFQRMSITVNNLYYWKVSKIIFNFSDTMGQVNSTHLFKVKGKGIVIPVLILTEHHAMEAYWGSGSIAPRILWPRH